MVFSLHFNQVSSSKKAKITLNTNQNILNLQSFLLRILTCLSSDKMRRDQKFAFRDGLEHLSLLDLDVPNLVPVVPVTNK